MSDLTPGQATTGTGAAVVRRVAGAALLGLLVAAAVLFTGRGQDGPAGVPPQVYRQVVLGIDAEALVERLLPAQPVDPRTGEPGAAAGALVDGCLHYQAADRTDLLYRFCFEDDRLVVRTAATSPS